MRSKWADRKSNIMGRWDGRTVVRQLVNDLLGVDRGKRALAELAPERSCGFGFFLNEVAASGGRFGPALAREEYAKYSASLRDRLIYRPVETASHLTDLFGPRAPRDDTKHRLDRPLEEVDLVGEPIDPRGNLVPLLHRSREASHDPRSWSGYSPPQAARSHPASREEI
jgi:hypothetical protein